MVGGLPKLLLLLNQLEGLGGWCQGWPYGASAVASGSWGGWLVQGGRWGHTITLFDERRKCLRAL